jgi:hypothetical protein
MINLLRTALTLVVVVASSPAQTTKVFTSPDRALQSVVVTNRSGESSVRIEGPSQNILLTRDKTSGDGSHGFGIIHSMWTADSQFFVASEQSSGGHQPWALPVWIYARAEKRVFELSIMGAVVTADFKLKPPDVIETEALVCSSGAGNPNNAHLSVSLHQLVSTGRLPMAPCPSR